MLAILKLNIYYLQAIITVFNIVDKVIRRQIWILLLDLKIILTFTVIIIVVIVIVTVNISVQRDVSVIPIINNFKHLLWSILSAVLKGVFQAL